MKLSKAHANACMNRAKKMLVNQIPNLIQECRKVGKDSIQYPSDENYLDEPDYQFFNPDREHTQYVVESLKNLGYEVYVETKEIEIEKFAHKRYFLHISW